MISPIAFCAQKLTDSQLSQLLPTQDQTEHNGKNTKKENH